MVASASERKKRIPKLSYTDSRGIGWHVSFRDPTSGLPKKHRFGAVPGDRREFSIINGSRSTWTASTSKRQSPGPRSSPWLRQTKPQPWW